MTAAIAALGSMADRPGVVVRAAQALSSVIRVAFRLCRLAFGALVYCVASSIRVVQYLFEFLTSITIARLCGFVALLGFLYITGFMPPVLVSAADAARVAVGATPAVMHALGFIVFVGAAFEGMVVWQNRKEQFGRGGWEASIRRRRGRGALPADDDENEGADNATPAYIRAKYSHTTGEYPAIDPLEVLTEKYEVPDIVAREMALMIHYIVRDFVGDWCAVVRVRCVWLCLLTMHALAVMLSGTPTLAPTRPSPASPCR